MERAREKGSGGAVPGRAPVVVGLGAAQAIAWASSVYLPAVLADPASAALHLSREWFFGAFSAALLLSAALSPWAGRLIDRNGGRGVLAASSVVFAAGLLTLAAASGWVGLMVAWALLGAGMALGLYEAAFATLAGLYGREARGAITGITLIGGFASTIGWPATSYLSHAFGWRDACVAWACAHVLIGLPLNLLLPRAMAAAADRVPGEAAAAVLTRPIVLLMVAFGCVAFVTSAMAAHLPRLLVASGLSPSAAIWTAALVGPAQVAARWFEFVILRRFSAQGMARLASGLHPAGAACLAVVGGGPGAVAFAVLHGAGNGMLTIARGTLPLALFGADRYGARTGLIAVPARLMQAAAPVLFGLVLDGAGAGAALAVSSGLSLAALAGLAGLRRATASPEPRS